MKNKYLLSLITCLFLAIIGGSWYYYHNYIATVNDYFLIKITPQQREKSVFGGYTYTKPEFEFEILPSYENDSIALSVQKADFKHHQEFILDYWNELQLEPTPKDAVDKMRLNARINAAKAHMMQQRILVRTTHIRKFSPDEALEMIQNHWVDNTIESFAKDKKVDFAIYNIY